MSIILSESDIRKIITESLLKEGLFRSARKSGEGKVSNTSKREARAENYDISQLSFTQLDMSAAGDAAKELHGQIGGASLNEEDHGAQIVELVHEPLYNKIKGNKNAFKTDKKGNESLFDYYSNNLATNHWSSWFLNRCYMDSAAWSKIAEIAKGFEHSGCCYPYAYIAKNNRPAVFNNPESMKGQKMLMIFSREEIINSPDLDFKPGVASIVGQGGGDPSWDDIRSSTELKSGSKHMNVYVGGNDWIGGNLSNSTGVKNDINKGGYMVFVRFNGLKSEPTRAVAEGLFRSARKSREGTVSNTKKSNRDDLADLALMPDDSRDISAVHPDFQGIVKGVIAKLSAEGFKPKIGSGYRSAKSQQEKIDKGYSKSPHLIGHHTSLDANGNRAAYAVDLVDERYNWESTKEAYDFFKKLGEIVESEYKNDIVWGGNWEKKDRTIEGETYRIGWDPAHIQWSRISREQIEVNTREGIKKIKSRRAVS